MDKNRIGVLDSFRALAILPVVAFHYGARWTPPRHPENLYPYSDTFAHTPLINYGWLGVELFFIISGFVITLTLNNSRNWQDFAIKRFARLFPAMLLCSLLTFAVLSLVPLRLFPVHPIDFISGLTFVEPMLWSKLLGRDVGMIDGAYWSLFVEAKFYFWACLLFFLFRRVSFMVSFAVLFNVAAAIGFTLALVPHQRGWMAEMVLFPQYIPWFAAGVGYYYLYHRQQVLGAHLLIAEAALVLLASALMAHTYVQIPFYLVIFGLFYMFAYQSSWLNVLRFAPLALIGEASYSLYLIHENVGVTLIKYVSDTWFGGSAAAGMLTALVVTALLIGLSVAIYRHWETPFKRVILGIGRRVLPGLAAAPARS